MIMGKDGEERRARVRIISRGKPEFISRPLQKSYPIDTKQEERHERKDQEHMNVIERPRRAVARDAEWCTRIILYSRESRRGWCQGTGIAWCSRTA